MAKYRKKPVVIDAAKWVGHNEAEIISFITVAHEIHTDAIHSIIKIHTLEGVMEASLGDYIIKGVNGEFYPCKPDIFDKTYVKVDV